MSFIKYAIIGSGAMGKEHIQNIALLKNAKVVALCDNHPPSLDNCLKTLKERIPTFHDHRELLKANLADVYIIATPNFTHIQILKDVISSGAHLLIEKPLCTTLKDCIELQKLTVDYPGLIWTAMEYRYMPPVAKFIEKIHSGAIGRLKMLSIKEHRHPFLKKVRDWNRFHNNTGGTLVEKCCHFFDLMRFITKSEAVRVYSSGGQDVNHLTENYGGMTPDIIDNAFVIVDFENGIRAFLDLCMFAENSKLQEELCGVGNKGKIETGVPSHLSGLKESDLTIRMRGSQSAQITKIVVDQNLLDAGHHHGSTYYEHLAFLKAINNKSKPEVSLDDGLKAVAIGQAAELSVKERRSVLLEELM
ncbi:MAG: Gfo/Idh/MocA family oxidoreductase [Pseudomonadota bacterium]|nr:Gfo/Idh/MocA family oxidoreductase [Pseudomonadota bacterium]